MMPEQYRRFTEQLQENLEPGERVLEDRALEELHGTAAWDALLDRLARRS